MVRKERIRVLKEGYKAPGPVAYWMSRDQRISDNWALLYAQELAVKTGEALAVVFCLVPEFLNATVRQYGYMLDGLQEIERDLETLNIPFFLTTGSPDLEIPEFLNQHHIKALVTDFDPLKLKRQWKKDIAKQLAIPFYEVDAHNIIPCWLTSSKLEYGAYTIRPKIRRLIPEFLEEYQKLQKHPIIWKLKRDRIDWGKIKKTLAQTVRYVNYAG